MGLIYNTEFRRHNQHREGLTVAWETPGGNCALFGNVCSSGLNSRMIGTELYGEHSIRHEILPPVYTFQP